MLHPSASPEILNPENWISNYYKYLFDYTRSRVPDNYTVEEIIQETFLSALKTMKYFQNKSTERTWLTSILKNKIVDHYRKNSTFKGTIEKRMLSNVECGIIQDSKPFEDLFSEVDHLIERYPKDIKKSILDSIEKLPARQSKVFKMRVIDDCGTETICKKLNISPNQVWVLMSRAKKNLAIKLKPELFSA